jgi:hypothetical protein
MVDIIGGHRIVDAVAEASGVPRNDLTGRRRKAKISAPRQLAMYLMDELSPHMTTPMMARALRRQDHTTILHGIRRWRNTLRHIPDNYDLEQRARAILTGGAARQNTEAVAGHASLPPRAHGLGRLPFASAVTASVTVSGVALCASEGDDLDSHRRASRRSEASLSNSPAVDQAGAPQPAAGASSEQDRVPLASGTAVGTPGAAGEGRDSRQHPEQDDGGPGTGCQPSSAAGDASHDPATAPAFSPSTAAPL